MDSAFRACDSKWTSVCIVMLVTPRRRWRLPVTTHNPACRNTLAGLFLCTVLIHGAATPSRASFDVWETSGSFQSAAAGNHAAEAPLGRLALGTAIETRSSVRIEYTLGSETDGEIAIYDVRGRLLRRLAVDSASAANPVLWDRRDTGGKLVARGIYFVRLTAGNARDTRKLVLLRG
jgi:hypothetical protein